MFQVQDQLGISYHDSCSIDQTLELIENWRENKPPAKEDAA
jgi:hypothetical protein